MSNNVVPTLLPPISLPTHLNPPLPTPTSTDNTSAFVSPSSCPFTSIPSFLSTFICSPLMSTIHLSSHPHVHHHQSLWLFSTLLPFSVNTSALPLIPPPQCHWHLHLSSHHSFMSTHMFISPPTHLIPTNTFILPYASLSLPPTHPPTHSSLLLLPPSPSTHPSLSLPHTHLSSSPMHPPLLSHHSTPPHIHRRIYLSFTKAHPNYSALHHIVHPPSPDPILPPLDITRLESPLLHPCIFLLSSSHHLLADQKDQHILTYLSPYRCVMLHTYIDDAMKIGLELTCRQKLNCHLYRCLINLPGVSLSYLS
ncbi:pollen-specific leucine-rich repeat extensin-like protein 1 [Octopus sinensis]|uniref:Pollen-specific leucine-rich repeat extensin-like protein 1 n=1 Tax=Octopus sinensis TaxID=2607531 RepID=A0A7E6FRL0_9MOLL|nr:pollen-specific leucine-rich repeat extensin-like protein 1 [Octopus sinensis]